MESVSRLEWNDQVQDAVSCGVILAMTAIASAAFSRSNYRLRPEARIIFRDIAIITGTFSLFSFTLAYGLAEVPPNPPQAPRPQTPRWSSPAKPRNSRNLETLHFHDIRDIPKDCVEEWDDYTIDMRELWDFMCRQDRMTDPQGISSPGRFCNPYTKTTDRTEEFRKKLMIWRDATGWRPTEEEKSLATAMRTLASDFLTLQPDNMLSSAEITQLKSLKCDLSQNMTRRRAGVNLWLRARRYDRKGYEKTPEVVAAASKVFITLPEEEREDL